MKYNLNEYPKLIYANEILDEQTVYSGRIKKHDFCIFSEF